MDNWGQGSRVVDGVLGFKEEGEENDTSGNESRGYETFQGLSPGSPLMSLTQVTSSLGSMLK